MEANGPSKKKRRGGIHRRLQQHCNDMAMESCHRMSLKFDPNVAWKVWLFTHADHAPKTDHCYSTLGSLLAIAGGRSFLPLTFQSKSQTACSRSPTEAETVALATALFSDAIPAQEFLSLLLGVNVPIICHQGNITQCIRNG